MKRNRNKGRGGLANPLENETGSYSFETRGKAFMRFFLQLRAMAGENKTASRHEGAEMERPDPDSDVKSGIRLPVLGARQYGLFLLLLFASLPAQARISSCDDRITIDHMAEVPGVPLSSASQAGDVLHRRAYLFSIAYTVATPINNDRMRLGAGWTNSPGSSPFQAIPSLPGMGIRWRHLENGFEGRVIDSGSDHVNAWSAQDDHPRAAGSYRKQEAFVQEFVLTDPKLYQGGKDYITGAGFNIFAHGTGDGSNQNVSRGCNQSAAGGARESPKLVYTFIVGEWGGGGGGPPPLPVPSCKVSLASQKLGVSMNSIDVSKLDHKDAVSQGSVPFSIRLEECAVNAKPSINFTDAGAPANSGNTLMPNNANVGGSAKGLGVRLRRNAQTDVYFGPPGSSDGSRRILVGTASSDNPVLTLDLNAHYVRTTDESIKPGAFTATATFVLSYP